MKTIKHILLLTCLFGISVLKLSAITCSQAGPDTISTNTVITGSCIINGDLIIVNGGALHVDLTGAEADTFIVRGNILLQGNGTLFIDADSGSTGAQFIVSNTSNNQRTIIAHDSSRVILQYVQFLTQEGNLSSASSYYMNFTAYDNSAFSATGCRLNTQTAWLLCNLMNQSSYIGSQSQQVPTEIYVQDSAQMSIQGPNTNIGIWMLFTSTTDTLNLPVQTSGPFSWQVGRGQGGVTASQWLVNVADATPGLGVQIEPTGKLVVNGRGAPATGEMHANLLFANGTDTVESLGAGVQNSSVANGRLTLNNVNLGPLGWQLYAVSNENLLIENSNVNEIGIEGPSNTVVVNGSVLQLATLSALGTGGSSLTVNNSQVWNQAIVAANGSTIAFNSCNVTGSWFSADAESHITVNNSCFFENRAGCTENTMVNTGNGQPNCNPFIPAGYPNILTPTTVSLNGVNSHCTSSVENLNGNDKHLKIYPNPFSTEAIIEADESLKYTMLTVYNAMGQPVKQLANVAGPEIILSRGNLPVGIYFVRMMGENNSFMTGKVVIGEN